MKEQTPFDLFRVNDTFLVVSNLIVIVPFINATLALVDTEG